MSGLYVWANKAGMTYVEAEVLREGNEQILNSLQEGVIILDEKTLNVQFKNETAKKLRPRDFSFG